jgi:mono/diheme cytochrome c family protein
MERLMFSLRSSGRALLTTAVVLLPVVLAAAGRQTDEGKRIFTGKGMCSTCHGPAAKGTPLAPDLTDGEWLLINGSVEAIDSLVRAGVAKPKKHPVPMPPRGGARLTDAEVRAVAMYVHGLTAQK